jgi:anti-sigma factor RsiW
VNDRRAHPNDDELACSELVELVTDYLEGALPAAQRRRVEAHLASCPGCTQYVEQMRTLAASLGELREEAIPPRLRDALIASFRERRV